MGSFFRGTFVPKNGVFGTQFFQKLQWPVRENFDKFFSLFEKVRHSVSNSQKSGQKKRQISSQDPPKKWSLYPLFFSIFCFSGFYIYIGGEGAGFPSPDPSSGPPLWRPRTPPIGGVRPPFETSIINDFSIVWTPGTPLLGSNYQ